MYGSRVVILLADDEELVRNMVAAIVQGDGYHVLIASDGSESLELSRRYNSHIHLLVSDIQMPGMTGVELATVLAQERPAIKVLLISGMIPEGEIPPTLQFLRKPFTPAALRQAMVGLLAPTE